MGYWMRVYSRSDAVMTSDALTAFFAEDPVTVEVCSGEPGTAWGQIELTNSDGAPITLIEVRRLATDSVAAECLADDIEALLDTEPRQNAEWVAAFLREVKVIYNFQILSGAYGDEDFGFACVRDLQNEIAAKFDGILYAQEEGFSNQEGAQITWEFDDDCEGPWWMALYDAKTQTWKGFQIELSDADHVAAFRAGRVPKGVKAR